MRISNASPPTGIASSYRLQDGNITDIKKPPEKRFTFVGTNEPT
jgi:hypothetical protein